MFFVRLHNSNFLLPLGEGDFVTRLLRAFVPSCRKTEMSDGIRNSHTKTRRNEGKSEGTPAGVP